VAVKDTAGRYFASFVVGTGDEAPLPPVDAEVGIDLGLTAFAVTSSGDVYVEDLCVTGLARTRLAKSVHDAGNLRPSGRRGCQGSLA
jgi:putative transposase